MKTALIGYTGFVGGNLKRQYRFDDLYNSQNITEIRGKKYDLIISAGAYAAKWLANKDPVKDINSITSLIEALQEIEAKEFILISTVDVYPHPKNIDENTKINIESLAPYGKNRLILEEFVQNQFSNHRILRLPGLFGDGLKKNVIFDFMNNNCIEMIHQDGVFQYYYLDRLQDDIEKIRKNNINLINIATEPISVKTLAKEIFDINFKNSIKSPPPEYDMHSIYSKLWGNQKNYLYMKDTVLYDLKQFIKRTKGK